MQDDPYSPGTSSILEEDTSRSLASVLKLAKTKGYLDTQAKEKKPAHSISASQKEKLQAKAIFVDERRDIRGSRGSQLRVVKEPEDYKPDINLEYTDDTGRKLSTKEAFKHMCYRFHGKGPGKKKIDKRLKKLEFERKMRQ